MDFNRLQSSSASWGWRIDRKTSQTLRPVLTGPHVPPDVRCLRWSRREAVVNPITCLAQPRELRNVSCSRWRWMGAHCRRDLIALAPSLAPPRAAANDRLPGEQAPWSDPFLEYALESLHSTAQRPQRRPLRQENKIACNTSAAPNDRYSWMFLTRSKEATLMTFLSLVQCKGHLGSNFTPDILILSTACQQVDILPVCIPSLLTQSDQTYGTAHH
jgi:hypothetical protein